MTMKKFTAYNIKYDTDGQEVNLPESMTIEAENVQEAQLYGADYISDKTGWCVISFEI
jgi:hypothetical protein